MKYIQEAKRVSGYQRIIHIDNHNCRNCNRKAGVRWNEWNEWDDMVMWYDVIYDNTIIIIAAKSQVHNKIIQDHSRATEKSMMIHT